MVYGASPYVTWHGNNPITGQNLSRARIFKGVDVNYFLERQFQSGDFFDENFLFVGEVQPNKVRTPKFKVIGSVNLGQGKIGPDMRVGYYTGEDEQGRKLFAHAKGRSWLDYQSNPLELVVAELSGPDKAVVAKIERDHQGRERALSFFEVTYDALRAGGVPAQNLVKRIHQAWGL